MADKFKYADYEESDAVKKARAALDANSSYSESADVARARAALDAHNNNQVADWTGGTYGESLKAAMDKINNREAFKYDLNGDALYQQYKDQYIAGGKLAMRDTMGQAAALTGGYGNSYAASVGNQAYQSYLQKLNDKVPELYRLAMDKYKMEGDQLKDAYAMYNDQYQQEYGHYRDRVADWNDAYNRLYGAYTDASKMDYDRFADARDYYANRYNNERSYDYGQYSDAYDRAFSQYQQSVAEDQYQQDFAEKQRQYDANMAEEQRQYDLSMAFDRDKLAEQTRQYDLDFAENQRQYNQDFAEKQRQYNSNLAEEQRQYALDMAEKQRQYNSNFAENQRQYDASLALDRDKLNETIRSNKVSEEITKIKNSSTGKTSTASYSDFTKIRDDVGDKYADDPDGMVNYLNGMVEEGYVSQSDMHKIMLYWFPNLLDEEAKPVYGGGFSADGFGGKSYKQYK